MPIVEEISKPDVFSVSPLLALKAISNQLLGPGLTGHGTPKYLGIKGQASQA